LAIIALRYDESIVWICASPLEAKLEIARLLLTGIWAPMTTSKTVANANRGSLRFASHGASVVPASIMPQARLTTKRDNCRPVEEPWIPSVMLHIRPHIGPIGLASPNAVPSIFRIGDYTGVESVQRYAVTRELSNQTSENSRGAP
jgi:hypothetical protein